MLKKVGREALERLPARTSTYAEVNMPRLNNCPRCGVAKRSHTRVCSDCDDVRMMRVRRRARDPDVRQLRGQESFWAKVERDFMTMPHMKTPCWIHDSARNHWRSYGSGPLRGAPTNASRAAWAYAHGSIADGLVVRHRCDNPGCVRIDHLEIGTPKDNANDMHERYTHKRVTADERTRRAVVQVSRGIDIRVAAVNNRVSVVALRRNLTAKAYKPEHRDSASPAD